MSSKVTIYQNKSKKVKRSDSEPPVVKIIEKFSPDPIHFDSKEEFIDHLTDNKDDMDKMSTRKLNKMFTIDGYKITKLKGEISLKSIKGSIKIANNSDVLDDINEKLQYIINLLTLNELQSMTTGRANEPTIHVKRMSDMDMIEEQEC